MSEGQDPRRLPGGGAAPTPPAPVQVQWPQTVAVIFNPSSGGDSASERGDRIRRAIEATGKQLTWLETTREDSGQGLAKDAVGQGADLVIATGGDGTVMACATALAGSQVPLAVLPLGTGNLVAANFDIPNDLDQALEIALACRRRRIDLGAIGDGRFVIAAGMGFDATFDVTNGWGGKHPLDVPVFVVSSSVPQEWVYEGSPFTFVTDGLESALEQAQAVAGDKDVGVGAASIVQQCIRSGLLDEIHMDLVPVLLGGGVRLFDHLGTGPIDLEITRVIEGAGVTHLTFRVLK